MKQYLPKKPIKRGFKVWVRADASTGFFCDFNVYTGKSQDNPGGVEYGLGEKVVLKLSKDIEGKYHQVFIDNYFSSCRLMDTLLERGIYSAGTVRQDRVGFPSALKTAQLAQGEISFRQRGSLVATVWRDKRIVSTLSTMTSPTDTTTVDRRQKDGTVRTISCPMSVAIYNRYMNGVDRGDQLRNYYKVRLKSTKYYKYIFWFLFDTAITNSFILTSFVPFSTTTLTAHSLKNFRLALSAQLIGHYNSRRRLRQQPSSSLLSSSPFTTDNVQPTPLAQPLHLPTHSRSKQCVYCHRHRVPARRKESVWYCQECTGQPTLCLTGKHDGSDCYRLWHSALQQ